MHCAKAHYLVIQHVHYCIIMKIRTKNPIMVYYSLLFNKSQVTLGKITFVKMFVLQNMLTIYPQTRSEYSTQQPSVDVKVTSSLL